MTQYTWWLQLDCGHFIKWGPWDSENKRRTPGEITVCDICQPGKLVARAIVAVLDAPQTPAEPSEDPTWLDAAIKSMSAQIAVEPSEPAGADHTTNTGETAAGEALNGPETAWIVKPGTSAEMATVINGTWVTEYAVRYKGGNVHGRTRNYDKIMEDYSYYINEGMPMELVTRQAFLPPWQKVDQNGS